METAPKMKIRDMPNCGYDGTLCNQSETEVKIIALYFMGALLILFTFVSTISYRNWKYEQEIVGLQWRINAAELTLGNHASVGSRVREVGLYSTSSSLTSRVRKYSLGPCASPYLLLVCQHLPVQLNFLFVTWPTTLLRVLCVARGPVLRRTGGLLWPLVSLLLHITDINHLIHLSMWVSPFILCLHFKGWNSPRLSKIVSFFYYW